MCRFQTYFPHVDNIYSHRSTQRYKRKPFVSHYWDCRLKGRPPGTPKSEDPNKKKRKRQARERDLCDVKIKITEYFPGARHTMPSEFDNSGIEESDSNNFFAPGQPGSVMPIQQVQRPFDVLGSTQLASNGTLRLDRPGSDGNRYYTIQRVNGNGGNGKGDGSAGPHKHTLDESDRVKKNSIYRHFLKEEKVKRKTQVSEYFHSGHHRSTSEFSTSNRLRMHVCISRVIATVMVFGSSLMKAYHIIHLLTRYLNHFIYFDSETTFLFLETSDHG